MKKLIDMIASGRAFDRLLELLVAAIPAIIIGAIIVGAYFFLIKYFNDKKQQDKVNLIKNLTPYAYIVFLVFLYLSPINYLPDRVFDPSFAFTIGQTFHFIADIILFAPLGFLFHLTKKNYAFSFGVPAGTVILIELLQYATKFGVATIRNTVAALIGTAIGVGVVLLIDKKLGAKKEG